MEPLTEAMPAQSKDGPADERIQIVATKRWADRVEEWRRKQPRIPNRSEAIRMMVDAFLDAEERAARLLIEQALDATDRRKR